MQNRALYGAFKTRVDCVVRVRELSVEMCKDACKSWVRTHVVVKPSGTPWGASIFPGEGKDTGLSYYRKLVGQGVVDDTGS